MGAKRAAPGQRFIPAVAIGWCLLAVWTNPLAFQGRIRTGTALDPAGINWQTSGYPVGAETTSILVVLRNNSGSQITLKSIGAVPGAGLGTVAEVADVRIGDERHPHVKGLGQYATDPPVSDLGAPFRDHPIECVQETLVPVSGFPLMPYADDEQTAVVVMRFATLEPGKAVVRSHRVLYEQGGTLYLQKLSTRIVIGVKEGRRPQSVSSDQGYCRGDSRLLPGNHPRTRSEEEPQKQG